MSGRDPLCCSVVGCVHYVVPFATWSEKDLHERVKPSHASSAPPSGLPHGNVPPEKISAYSTLSGALGK
ncbi:hypothetical protein CYLTODRAFT_450266 [Cylindrobasidium torrendii FP15055 ss-10]|uniref:Uncharacterized protein n=1 Tax=Cylindrobasidium torrendii FP15055 ss-10 TaxID=1314674 RepID=A0A0D7BQQ4_9AGAR|nr:hypothetical protein CYLTODRAFT_450266 [Cylindrobasidium torrendii FP15055 ss-10]